jgi:hypothetical protein
MKSKVKFPLVLSLALLCLMSGCYIIEFDRPEEDYEPHINTEPGKITAENYSEFGRSITTDGDHVLVSNFDDIHIFKYNSSGIELIQTIDLDFNYSNFSMIVYRSELIFGHVDGKGTGTVYVYSRNGDVWELGQEIRKGRGQDRFGWSIDIDDETMVIGANSFRSDCDTANTCQGMVYVFEKKEGVWEETQEILADQSGTGDWDQTCVGIYGDLMLVGSPTQPLHLYKFNGVWELLRTEEIHARKIAHFENNFMVSGDDDFRAFILEPDGSLSENTINSVNKRGISWSGEIIEMRDSLAIVGMENEDCYLLKYGNRQWNVEKVFSPDPGENCAFQGMEITDQHAIIGGMNFEDYFRYGYVYFRDL